jgi:hypothetical protein
VFAAPSTASEAFPQVEGSGVSRPSLWRFPRRITWARQSPIPLVSHGRFDDLCRGGESEKGVKPSLFRSLSGFFLGNRMSVRWQAKSFHRMSLPSQTKGAWRGV